MNPRIEPIIDHAQEHMREAADEDRELGPTVFYCAQALFFLLGGILNELAAIHDDLSQKK